MFMKRVIRLVVMGTLLPLALTAADFTVTKSAPDSEYQTGESFIYTIQYNCQSTTDDCVKPTITDEINESFEIVRVYSSNDVTSVGQDGQKITWNLGDSLAAGSTGEVKVKVRLLPGIVPDGLEIDNVAWPARDGTVGTGSSVKITTKAEPRWFVNKELIPEDGDHVGEVYPDRNATYRINICTPSGDDIGGLNLLDTTVVDTLPEGATFVEASGGGVYDPDNHTVTWDMGDLNVTEGEYCYQETVKVFYDANDSSNEINTSKTNTFTATATLPGGDSVSYEASITNPMKQYIFYPHWTPGFEKTGVDNGTDENWFRDDTSSSDHNFTYYLRPTNDGNVPLYNYYFVDHINTAEVTLLEVRTGVYNEPGTVRVEYRKLNDSNWISLGEYDLNASVTFSSANGDFNATDGSDEVAEIRFSYLQPVPPGFRPTTRPTLLVKLDNPGSYSVGDTIDNNATLSAEDNVSNVLPDVNVTATIYVRDNYSVPRVTKTNDTGGEEMAPGDTVTYFLKVENSREGTGTLVKPIVTDLLPKGFFYVDNSVQWTNTDSDAEDPDCGVIEDFNATGRQLLRCRFDGEFPRGTSGTLSFRVTIDNTAGFGSIDNTAKITTNDTQNPYECGTGVSSTDTLDEDGDGDTSDLMCESTNKVAVLDATNLSSSKWVKGQLDEDYSRYPDYGWTVSGGSADYKLTIVNNGNVAAKNLEILDILPFEGDTGVTDTRPRDTEWRPNLQGKIDMGSLPATVYYSVAGNPCRGRGVQLGGDYLIEDDPACQDADWSTEPPSDISKVRSVLIVFDPDFTIEPDENITFTWPMSAPVGSPSDKVAWNSFAFKATRIDGQRLLPAEPIKVGIKVQEDTNNSYGDFVWLDINKNGLQDDGEPGVNGVTVELYKDGNTTPYATTTTATDYNGRMGAYTFGDLPDGTYHAKFILPDGYAFTTQNAGSDDTVDSDADPQSGETADVSLSNGTHTVDWDAGLVAVDKAALGNRVWYDSNYNGIQDPGEANASGVVIRLLDENGNTLDRTATTNHRGEYLFTDLTPGNYIVEFVPPYQYILTDRHRGSDGAADSDPYPETNRTAVITLSAGEMNVTIDAGLFLPAAMGDRVWHDRNANGIQDDGEPGIADVNVTLVRELDGMEFHTVTDGDGYYHFENLHPGDYHVRFDYSDSDFARNATYPVHVSAQDQGGDDAKDSDVNPATLQTATFTLHELDDNLTVDMGLYVPASLGDRVWIDVNGNGLQDSDEPGVPNVRVCLKDADDQNVTVDANGSAIGANGDGCLETNSSGEYRFENLVPGVYHVVFDPTTLPDGYVFTHLGGGNGTPDATDSDADRTSGVTANTTLSSDEDDMSWDAGIFIPVTIGDYTWIDTNGNGIQDSDESPLAQVPVDLYTSAGVHVTTDLNGTALPTETNTTGGYLFENLSPGTYYVVFGLPDGYKRTLQDADGAADTNDSDADPDTGRTGNYTLLSGDENLSVDAGYYKPVTIGDRVWIDVDANGIQDDGEENLSGVTVELIRDGASTGIITTTTATGYLFEELAPGHRYSVKFTRPNGYVFTFPNRGDDNATDSDALSDGSVEEQTPVTVSGDVNLTFDAGVFAPASIGDRIWLDLDADGIQDSDESNYTGEVTVTLYDENNQSVTDASGNVVDPVTTTNGSYRFENLVPGTYHVCFELPSGVLVSPQDAGSDDALDSDMNATTGCTANTTLVSGENDTSWDAGVYELAALGDKVWIDTNGNGIQDESDVPTDFNVTVELYRDGNASPVATQLIEPGDNGLYKFVDLEPGSYHVKFILPQGSPYVFTVANQGDDDAEDSDVDAGGVTPSETLVSGEENLTLDAGLYIPASLGDRVWLDADADGVQDPDESNVSDLNVTLLDEEGNVLRSTTTDDFGRYSFTGLQPGTYRVRFALEDAVGNRYRVSPMHSADANASTDNDANASGVTEPVTLESGEDNPAIDAGLYIPVAVGDFVWSDANGDGIQNDGNSSGIPDVNVTLYRIDEQGDRSVVASLLTGPDGRYLFEGLTPGEYQVHFEEPAHYRTTLENVGSDSNDSDANRSTGDTVPFVLVSPEDNLTLDAGYYALAVIEGNVTEDLDNNDSGDVGLQDVNITLTDRDGNLIAWTLTDVNGSYRFIDVEPGDYFVTEIQPEGYLDVSENEGGDDNDTGNDTLDNTIAVSVGIGEVDTGNDFVEEKDASIGDYVWVDMNKNGIQDSDEEGLADINVTLYNERNESLGWTLTDESGHYLFDGLPEGDYYVEFNLSQMSETYDDLYRVTDQDVNTTDDEHDSDANRTTGRTALTHLLPGEDDLSWDMGVYPLATIRGNVSERDGNGEYHPMADVEIQLLYPDGTPVLDENGQPVTTMTDENGNYVFTGVEPGEYIVREVQPEGYYDVSENEGGDDNDSVAGTGDNEIGVVVVPGENDTGNDFVEEQAAILGDRVWYDTDHNGIQDANETGMPGIGVCLLDANGDPVLDVNGNPVCTETNETGEYRFDNLDPEFEYAVEFNLSDLPTEYHEPTLQNQGGDEALDSDADAQGITDPVALVPGEFYRDLDMGVWAPFAHVGDVVWFDDNHNGIQDPDEDPVPGVTVEIFDANGSPAYDGFTGAHSVVTDENGTYGFDVLPGDYELRFTLPADLIEEGYGFTRSNRGNDEADSDVNSAGITEIVHLDAGENVVTLDAGVACACDAASVGGDGGSAMGRVGGLLMVLLTMGLGWLAVRRQEEEMMRKDER